MVFQITAHVSLIGLLALVFAGAPRLSSAHSVPMEPSLISQVYKQAVPAIVLLNATRAEPSPNVESSLHSVGSGIVLDQKGLILTNNHVIDGATKIVVILNDGIRLDAQVVGNDPMTDLALLQVSLPKGRYTVAEFGDSDRLEIGQPVLTIGHPFGLDSTLTTGVISGFLSAPEPHRQPQRLIQSSAAINPGNSGGPLLDLAGHVIGVNAAMLAGAQNVGFAIPSNTVKTVVQEIQSYGRVIRPWLGIGGQLITRDLMQLFAMPLTKGIVVSGIAKGSPAEKAGLRSGQIDVTVNGERWLLGGDILVAINAKPVTTAEQFAVAIQDLEVGDLATLRYMRQGTLHTTVLTIEERPPAIGPSAGSRMTERVGFKPLAMEAHNHGTATGIDF
jgi:S1-C subfamily serine protease